MALPKWTEEREDTLKSIVGSTEPVSVETVKEAAESLETTARSISSKLRKMGFEVESTAEARGKSYTDEEEAEIEDFLKANPSTYTYAEVAAAVLNGSRTAKQIQGKILSMQLTDYVKPTPKKERVRTYTEAEEEKLTKLVLAGGYIEDIADAMGRPVNSIRGKILSMSRENPDITIPKQRNYKTKEQTDALAGLGDVSEMTVEDIATAIEKTERGVKAMLTHRGITCKNYDGAKKRAKIEEAKSAA